LDYPELSKLPLDGSQCAIINGLSTSLPVGTTLWEVDAYKAVRPNYANTYQPDCSTAPLRHFPVPGCVTSEEVIGGRRLGRFELPPETPIPKTHFDYSKGASLSLSNGPIIPSKPFQCPICDKEYARRETLKRHFVAKPCGKRMTPEQEKGALKGRLEETLDARRFRRDAV
jgi:hypothetical protein